MRRFPRARRRDVEPSRAASCRKGSCGRADGLPRGDGAPATAHDVRTKVLLMKVISVRSIAVCVPSRPSAWARVVGCRVVVLSSWRPRIACTRSASPRPSACPRCWLRPDRRGAPPRALGRDSTRAPPMTSASCRVTNSGAIRLSFATRGRPPCRSDSWTRVACARTSR